LKKLIKGRNLLYRVNPKDIAFINAIFEWYHEVGTVRTRNPKEGLIEIWVAPDFYEDALKAVDYLVSGGFVERMEFVKEVGDDWWRE